MAEALKLLEAERERKTALRDSYKRQLDELNGRREQAQEAMKRLKADMDKLKPPSALLQKEYEKLVIRDQGYAADQQRVRADMNRMSKEIQTLSGQIKQLGGTV